jgi:hypothetical protein
MGTDRHRLGVAFTANSALAITLADVAWALWLSVPIGATSMAALLTWWRGLRARRAQQLDTDDAMRAHADYLAALVIPARSDKRPEHAEVLSGCVVVASSDLPHTSAS